VQMRLVGTQSRIIKPLPDRTSKKEFM